MKNNERDTWTNKTNKRKTQTRSFLSTTRQEGKGKDFSTGKTQNQEFGKWNFARRVGWYIVRIIFIYIIFIYKAIEVSAAKKKKKKKDEAVTCFVFLVRSQLNAHTHTQRERERERERRNKERCQTINNTRRTVKERGGGSSRVEFLLRLFLFLFFCFTRFLLVLVSQSRIFSILHVCVNWGNAAQTTHPRDKVCKGGGSCVLCQESKENWN